MTAPRPAGQDSGHRQTAERVVSRTIARPWREQRDVIAAALAAADRDGYQRGREEVLREVEALAEELDREGVVQRFHGPHNENQHITDRLRTLLDGPDTGRRP